MNLRKSNLIEKLGLMTGNRVPQPDYIYYLELEKYGPGEAYKRTWFHLDNLCQKDHSHIPEENENFVKRVKKTRNHKLCRRMQLQQGICIEHENLEQEG